MRCEAIKERQRCAGINGVNKPDSHGNTEESSSILVARSGPGAVTKQCSDKMILPPWDKVSKSLPVPWLSNMINTPWASGRLTPGK
jgi:hypothetical protein